LLDFDWTGELISAQEGAVQFEKVTEGSAAIFSRRDAEGHEEVGEQEGDAGGRDYPAKKNDGQGVGAEAGGGQVDQRGDADRKDAQDAENGGGYADTPCHSRLDSRALSRVASGRRWASNDPDRIPGGLVYLRAERVCRSSARLAAAGP
jgi:hypothetical protein